MSNPVAVITGAGSGVGAAVAQALAAEGWRVALIGRRREALEKVAAELPGALAIPCDVGDPAQVRAMAERVLAGFGSVQALINAAGWNVPRRSLAELAAEDYEAILAANLHGAFHCVQAFLPAMRQRGSGTIVNISSEAGKQASPKAGPAYVMAKFGLAGLTQSINAEERAHGLRACTIFPGDIDTPLLDRRPTPPDAAARAKMLQPEDVAACVQLVLQLPQRAVVEELVIRPR